MFNLRAFTTIVCRLLLLVALVMDYSGLNHTTHAQPLTPRAEAPPPGVLRAVIEEVAITDGGFLPDVITVTVGTTITWTNTGTQPHQVVQGIPTGGATLTPSPTPLVTNTPTATPISPTNTPTTTSVPPTTTPSPTGVPPTSTPTPTTVPPTVTETASPTVEPPTNTPTVTGVPPSNTPTATEIPPTATVTASPTEAVPPSQTPPATVTLPHPTVTATATDEPTSSAPIQFLPLIYGNSAATERDGVPNEALTPLWDSGILQPGNTFSYGFETIGTFAYYDALNPALVGQVIVVPPNVSNINPVIAITSPAADAILPVALVTVSGSVSDEDGTVVSVEVNGVSATLTGNTFEVDVPVANGAQSLIAIATDDANGVGSATRVVQGDGEGPIIEITAPANGQSVYTTQPTILATYSDFLSSSNSASLSAIITNESGASQDVTADLTIANGEVQGTLTTALTDDTVYTLTLTLLDTLSNSGTAQTVFYVPVDPATIIPPVVPPQAGWISGRVYDSATCDEHLTTCEGMAGVEITLEQVELAAVQAARVERQAEVRRQAAEDVSLIRMEKPTAVTANDPVVGTIITGPDGFFAFPVADTAIYWLRAEKEGFTYGQREAEIVRERSTATNPIYLTPLDGAVTACDDDGCFHTNSDGSMQVEIPAGAIPAGETYDIRATVFDNVEFLPSGELPPNTWETYAFNLSGASEVTFNVPVTVRQANTRGFSAGTPIPLGYWNQTTLEWEHAGTGVVDPSGVWIEMEITHFSNYDCNDPINPPGIGPGDPGEGDNGNEVPPRINQGGRPPKDDDEEPCGAGTSGCYINIQSGEFEEWVELPSVIVLNEAMAPQLRYDTGRVINSSVIDVDLVLEYDENNVEVGDYLQYELYIAGERTDLFTFMVENPKQAGRYRYYWDGQDAQGRILPPGAYEYEVLIRVPYVGQYCYALNGIFGNPADCVNGATGVFVDADATIRYAGMATVEGDPANAFGNGWVLDGQQRLHQDEDGNILISDGRRNDEFYFAPQDLVVQSPPLEELPLAWLNHRFSFGQVAPESFQALPELAARAWSGTDITVGDQPESVVISPDGTTAYVPNFLNNSLSVINSGTNMVQTTISVARRPMSVVLNQDGTIAYATSALDDVISVVDLTTQQMTETISVGDNPRHIALAPDGLTAYVANLTDDNISVVDLTTKVETAVIPTGNNTNFIAVSPNQPIAYVLRDVSPLLTVVNLTTNTVSDTIDLNIGLLEEVVFSPDGSTAYVTDGDLGIGVIDVATGTLLDHVEPFSSATSLALSQDGTTAYVGNLLTDNVLAVDLATLSVSQGWMTCNGISGITENPSGTMLYVSCRTSDAVRAIPIGTAANDITTVETFGEPQAMELSADGKTVYLAKDSSSFADSLGIFDLMTGAQSSITVGRGVRDIALSADGRFVYITGLDELNIIDVATQTLLDSILIPGNSAGIALSGMSVPSGGDTLAYITNTDTNQLLIIDLSTGTVIGTVPVGDNPQAVAHTNNALAFVTNEGDSSVSVINLLTESVIGTIDLPFDSFYTSRPEGVAFSPDSGTAYVVAPVGNNEFSYLYQIDVATQTIIERIRVGGQARRLAITPDGAVAYLATHIGVQILDLASLEIIGVISSDTDPAYDVVLPAPSDSRAYPLTPTDVSWIEWDEDSQTFSRHYPDGRVIQFTFEGWHDKTTYADGRQAQYTYDSEGRVLTYGIVPPSESTPRWTWAFAYTNGLLASITDPAGRITTIAIDDAQHLREVEMPDGSTQRFTYNADGLMTHHQNENGDVVEQEYDAYGRIAAIIEAPRPVYDQATDTISVIQEVRTFTPADTHYSLINDSSVGTPDDPAPAMPLSEDIEEQVEYGRGSMTGHTDVSGRWLDITDGESNTTYFAYDRVGNRVYTRAPDGDCQLMQYNPNGDVTRVEEGEGSECNENLRTTEYSYEPRFGRLKSITTPTGETTTYIYDYEETAESAGRVIRIEYPTVQDETGNDVQPTKSYTYNTLGLIETVTDERGMVTRYLYTQGIAAEAGTGATPLFLPGVVPVPGLLTQIIKDEGGIARTTIAKDFTEAGLPTTMIEAGGQTITTYTYDSMNRMTTTTNALGIVTALAYDNRGNLIERVEDYTADGTTGRNIRTLYTYQPDDQIILERTTADGLTIQARRVYDINGMLAMEEDGRGYQSRYRYDDADRLVSMMDPAGFTTTYTYFPDGNMESITDPEGSVTRYTYDQWGRKISQVVDDGGLNLTTTYEYDGNNNLITETHPDGTATCYGYDGLDRQRWRVQDCGGLELYTEYFYTLTGDRAKIVSVSGIITLYERDALGRLVTEERNAEGTPVVTTYTYDAAGNIATITDPRGTISTYGYDALNRQTSLCGDSAGLNLCTTYTYDRLNQIASIIDAKGITTLVTHDAWGQKRAVVEDAGRIHALSTYAYDEAMNLVGITDANGNDTLYTYGPRNEMVYELYADGSAIGFEWDGRGKQKSRTDQSGAILTNTYDGAGRLTDVQIDDEGTQSYGYDAMGRITTTSRIMDGVSTGETRTYNALGEVLTQIQTINGLSWTVSYGYDYLADVYTTTYPSGVERVWTIDELDRLSTIEDGSGTTLATYTYDPLHAYDRVTYTNGVSTQRDYDPLNRISRVSSAVADYRYGYDETHHRLYQQRAHQPGQPADVYLYDDLYRITNVWYGADSTNPGTITTQTGESEYDLDTLRNRLALISDGVTTEYGPTDGEQLLNPMNRYESVANASITYDAQGNLLDDGRNHYTYDPLNRMIGVENEDSSTDYWHNATERRVAKIVDGVATYFIYDKHYQILEERSAADVLVARYTYGTGIDNVLMMERGGNTFYYHKDAQGNITEVTTSAGVLTERYEYDIDGRVAILDENGMLLTDSAIGNPWMYTARYYDSESGNFDFRSRAYSPHLGRFLQMDALGYVDGLNLYASYFAVNDTDPTGHSPNPIQQEGPLLSPEFELYSTEVYAGFGAGIKVTLTAEGTDCCKGKTKISEGMKTLTYGYTLEGGLGVGGSANVMGVGVELLWKGPQVHVESSISTRTTTCGGPFQEISLCGEIGVDLGQSMEGSVVVGLEGQMWMTGAIKPCASITTGGQFKYVVSFCGEVYADLSIKLGPYTTQLWKGTADEGCRVVYSYP